MLDVTLRHDASRIVQSILQFGTHDQRQIVLNELCANNTKNSNTKQKKGASVEDIAKSPYGHFVILKALQCCKNKDELSVLITHMRDRYISLGCHAISARVIETIYMTDHISNSIKHMLNAEYYGKKYTVHLPADIPADSLVTVMKYISTHHKQISVYHILDHMHDIIHRFVEKGLLDFTYVHQFIYEYAMEVMKLDNNYTSGSAAATATAAAVTTSSTISQDIQYDQKSKEFERRMKDLLTLMIDHIPRCVGTKVNTYIYTCIGL